MYFWNGFYKKASIGPKVGISRGMFSRNGIAQAVKKNPLPQPRASGRGVNGMVVP